MRVALMIEGQEGVSWEQWLALARACEEHRIEALFRSDHYLSQSFPHERVAHDAWTTLAAIAAHTTTLRLGTLVSPVTFRHPSLLANAVSTVDHISEGRVELGMGAGWMDLEHAAFGFPFPRLGERIEMLGEQPCPLAAPPAWRSPLRAPPPPLLVGGRAKPKTAALAAHWADEYNVIGSTRDDYADARRSLDEECERADRDPKTLRMSVMTGFLVGEDEDALLAHARATLERWGSDLDPADLVSRQRAKGTAGTPDELAAGLRSLEEVGVERAMLQHIRHEDLDTIGLLGREVLPRL